MEAFTPTLAIVTDKMVTRIQAAIDAATDLHLPLLRKARVRVTAEINQPTWRCLALAFPGMSQADREQVIVDSIRLNRAHIDAMVAATAEGEDEECNSDTEGVK